MSAPAEVKTFKVTGGAAEDYASQLSGGRKRRATRRRGAHQTGGAGSLGVGVVAPSTPPQVKLAEVTKTDPPNAPFTQDMKPNVASGGGVKKEQKEQKEQKEKPKVILAPPKKSKPVNKVILAPPRRRHTGTGTHATRKIRVGLNGMRRRLTRAKKISDDSEKKGVEEIRRALVDAKLIKDGSKVPESLMRTMYKDYLLLKDRAL